jgi:hypothetical protein
VSAKAAQLSVIALLFGATRHHIVPVTKGVRDMATKKLGPCVCCGEPGKFSIILAVGPNNKPVDIDRYYIPNENVREHIGTGMDVSQVVPFCADCMRRVEDNLRATIIYIQSENDLLEIKPAKGDFGD